MLRGSGYERLQQELAAARAELSASLARERESEASAVRWAEALRAREAELAAAKEERETCQEVIEDLNAGCAELEREHAALKDSARLEWLETELFARHWDGCINHPNTWHMTGSYRHTLHQMRGPDLRTAIDAAAGATPKPYTGNTEDYRTAVERISPTPRLPDGDAPSSSSHSKKGNHE